MTADSLFSLKGKTALVTGASYGLGVTFAETLGRRGRQSRPRGAFARQTPGAGRAPLG